jgi:hypothetical protein
MKMENSKVMEAEQEKAKAKAEESLPHEQPEETDEEYWERRFLLSLGHMGCG